MKQSHMLEDVKAWRELARGHMPDWQPTLQGLQRLDEGPGELLVALRSIARGWDRNDARWDVLMAVLEFYKRQHAHELAEKIREDSKSPLVQQGGKFQAGELHAADLIDPEVPDGS
jgi:hypothetical protein